MKREKSSKKKKLNKGKSNIFIIIAAIVVVSGLVGYYILSQKGSVTIPAIKPPLNADCKLKDPELCKFMNNWSAQTNYSVVSNSTFGGKTVESTYEISGSDKFHMMSKMDGKENSNMISIGDTTYTLDYSDNKWWKQTLKKDQTNTESTVEQQAKEEKNQFDEKNIKDTTTYTFIAKEACGDLTCFKYEVTDSAAAGSKQFIWFDDKDYLLRKIRIEDKDNGAMESIYSYSGISINAPSPVKEGEPQAPGMNNAEIQKMMKQIQQSPADNSNGSTSDGSTQDTTQDANTGY